MDNSQDQSTKGNSGTKPNYQTIYDFFKHAIDLGLIVSIVALIWSICDSNQNQRNERIVRITDDFSQIATMNKSRITCLERPPCPRALNVEEYKRTLEINYKLHSRFIKNTLDYHSFEKFHNLIKEMKENNQVEVLNNLNIEIDNLIDIIISTQ